MPALATASGRAPVRARMVPATRSQTIRGRSSPNSCRGVAAVQHVQHVLELAALEVGVGPRAPDEGVELVDRHALVPGARGDGDDLLRQHVERVARHHRRLDEALAHAPRHDGALEQVGAELGEDPSARHLAHAVPGAADALQAARHRLRRLHLHDEVDGAHVDAQLERRRRDQAGQRARLEQVLDDDALLARQRAVVGAGDLARALPRAPPPPASRQVVEPQGDALRGAAVVHEHERRAVLADQPQQLRIDGRPDAAPGRLAAGDGVELERRVRLDHRLHGHVDAQVERLAHAGVDDGAVAAGPTRKRATSSSGRCVADSPMRCTSRPACSASRSERHARGASRAWSAPPRGSRRR